MSVESLAIARQLGSAFSRPCTRPLMREWIHAMLYDPQDGYFAKANHPVAPVTSPIPFTSLDSSTYLEHVAAQYTTLRDKWLTPSEIFSPWMGRAIGNHIASRGIRRVVEIGSGSGTLALDIINYLKSHAYGGDFSYTSIEISASLSRTQQRRMQAAGHDDVYVSRVADATRESTWKRSENSEGRQAGSDMPTFILGMEVLDNLPHDKVVQVDGVWHQTRIDVDTRQEVLEPVTDDTDDGTISRTLDAYESIQNEQASNSILKWLLDTTGTPDPVWLPTGAMSLLDAVRHVPNHELLLGDFDFLPGVVIPGENAPIVSSTVDGKARDRGELLSAPFGSVDIFFPTNFRLLSAMYKVLYPAGETTVEKAGTWLGSALPDGLEAVTCLDGVCPLVDDYKNTSFALLSTLGSIKNI